MMYRCGWATKENQERVLAIKMTRDGFNNALKQACLSSYDANVHSSYEAWRSQLQTAPVRIQWDPEKDIRLNPLSYKSVQIGLSGEIVKQYINNWITGINDITDYCTSIHQLIKAGKFNEAASLLPAENLYLLPDSIAGKINSDQNSGK